MGPMSTPESTVVHLMRHGEVHNPDGILYGPVSYTHLTLPPSDLV